MSDGSGSDVPVACAPIDEDLSAWLDGELAAVRTAAVAAHVEGCARCAARAEELRTVDRGLRALADATPGAGSVARRLARLRARLATEAAGAPASDRRGSVPDAGAVARPQGSAPARRRRRAAPWAAAAAAALLAALVVPRALERALPPAGEVPLAPAGAELAQAPPPGLTPPAAAPPAARPVAPAPAAIASGEAFAARAPAPRAGALGASAEADTVLEAEASAADPASAARAQASADTDAVAAEAARELAPAEREGLDAADLAIVARLDALVHLTQVQAADERQALFERLRRLDGLTPEQRARLRENLERWRAMTPEARADWARVWAGELESSVPAPIAPDRD